MTDLTTDEAREHVLAFLSDGHWEPIQDVYAHMVELGESKQQVRSTLHQLKRRGLIEKHTSGGRQIVSPTIVRRLFP